MENEELMRKLAEAWKNVEESLVSPTPIEGAVIAEDADKEPVEGNK